MEEDVRDGATLSASRAGGTEYEGKSRCDFFAHARGVLSQAALGDSRVPRQDHQAQGLCPSDGQVVIDT